MLLGFYLNVKSSYWYEKMSESPQVEWVRSIPEKANNVEIKSLVGETHAEIRQRSVHSNPIIYGSTTVKDFRNLQIVRSAILYNHFTKKKVYCLNRRHTRVEWGSSSVKAQRVVCFDIDGPYRTEYTEVVRALVSTFPEVKFIEHNIHSQGYHLYIHFDRAVTDQALKRLEEDFNKRGFTIEVVPSTGHIRLPMGRQYSLYGLYSTKNKSLVQKVSFNQLLDSWKDYKKFAYFDPSLEMEESPRYKKEFRGSYKRKKEAQKDLKQMLLDNPSFDYGAERDTKR